MARYKPTKEISELKCCEGFKFEFAKNKNGVEDKRILKITDCDGNVCYIFTATLLVCIKNAETECESARDYRTPNHQNCPYIYICGLSASCDNPHQPESMVIPIEQESEIEHIQDSLMQTAGLINCVKVRNLTKAYDGTTPIVLEHEVPADQLMVFVDGQEWYYDEENPLWSVTGTTFVMNKTTTNCDIEIIYQICE